jgi:hypothetical protein
MRKTILVEVNLKKFESKNKSLKEEIYLKLGIKTRIINLKTVFRKLSVSLYMYFVILTISLLSDVL